MIIIIMDNNEFIKFRWKFTYNKMLKRRKKFYDVVIHFRPVFEDNGRFFPQLFLEECLYKFWILYYDRPDICKGIDLHKASAFKECIICHYF